MSVFRWSTIVCVLLLHQAWLASSPGQEVQQATETPLRISASSSVIRQHKPGLWSVLGVTASNGGDQPGEALVAVSFLPDDTRQFLRQVWLPPHSKRSTWLPVLVPGNIPATEKNLNLRSRSLDVSGGREVLNRRFGELLSYDVLTSLDHDSVKTGSYLRKPVADEFRELRNVDMDASLTVQVARERAGLTRNVSEFDGDFLPPWADVLQSYDSILLTADRIQDDAAGLVALRAWIRDGGRLWVTLDRVSPSTLSAILGNSVNLEVVDRVELDAYVIEPTVAESGAKPPDRMEFETPVPMVRVVTSATDIPYKINGWPAAIWVPYGEGEVLITTLAPAGWRAENSESSTEALRQLAIRVFAAREGRLTATDFQPALAQRIGYRVPGRGLALTILGGYCVGLLGAGLVLLRLGRLDRMAVAVPAVTLVATLVLLGVGLANSTRVPPTIAYMQLVRFAPQTDEARIDGLAAMYDQQTHPVTWQGESLGWAIPDMSGDGDIRRLAWSDDDRVETQNAQATAGSISLATLHASTAAPGRVAVEAHFGPRGLEGKFQTVGLEDVSDFVIAGSPAPALAVPVGADGSFVSGPEQVLAADQYSAETLLSDAQRQRQDVLRKLLDPTDTFAFPRQHSLFFWFRPLPANLQFPEGFETNGTALGVLPLEIGPTAPQSRFVVPATFLRASTVAGRQGISTAFSVRSGQWVRNLTVASDVALRFQLPAQVLPCQLESATVDVRCNIPSRELQVLAYGNGEPELIESFRNASGVLNITIPGTKLALDAQGGVRIGLVISPTDAQRERQQFEQAAANNAAGGPPGPTGPPGSGGPPGPRGPGQGSSGAGGSSQPLSEFDNSTWNIDYARLTVTGVKQ